MKQTKRVFISGLVQGVFFRAFIKDEADKLQIKGYVRNLKNGKVEAVLEGKSEDVKKMITKCKQGAPHSRVDEVEVENLTNQGFKEFKILKI